MRSHILIRCCIVLLTAATVVAQEAATPTVDEIVARYIEAIGGQEKIDAIKTARLHGGLAWGPQRGTTAPLRLEYKAPNKFRSTLFLRDATGIEAYDGQEGWYVPATVGEQTPEKMSGPQIEVMKRDAELHGPLVRYRERGHRVELVGREEIDEAPTFKLKVTRANGDIEHHYLNALFYIPLMVKGTEIVKGEKVPFKFRFSDYRKTGGVAFPRAVLQTLGDAPSSKRTIDRVEINTPIPDSHFEMPQTPAASDASGNTP